MASLSRTVSNIYEGSVLANLYFEYIDQVLEEIDLEQETIYKIKFIVERSFFLQEREEVSWAPVFCKKTKNKHGRIWEKLPDEFTILNERVENPAFQAAYIEIKQKSEEVYAQFIADQKGTAKAYSNCILQECWKDLAEQVEKFRNERGPLALVTGKVFLNITTKRKDNEELNLEKKNESSFEICTEEQGV